MADEEEDTADGSPQTMTVEVFKKMDKPVPIPSLARLFKGKLEQINAAMRELRKSKFNMPSVINSPEIPVRFYKGNYMCVVGYTGELRIEYILDSYGKRWKMVEPAVFNGYIGAVYEPNGEYVYFTQWPYVGSHFHNNFGVRDRDGDSSEKLLCVGELSSYIRPAPKSYADIVERSKKVRSMLKTINMSSLGGSYNLLKLPSFEKIIGPGTHGGMRNINDLAEKGIIKLTTGVEEFFGKVDKKETKKEGEVT